MIWGARQVEGEDVSSGEMEAGGVRMRELVDVLDVLDVQVEAQARDDGASECRQFPQESASGR